MSKPLQSYLEGNPRICSNSNVTFWINPLRRLSPIFAPKSLPFYCFFQRNRKIVIYLAVLSNGPSRGQQISIAQKVGKTSWSTGKRNFKQTFLFKKEKECIFQIPLFYSIPENAQMLMKTFNQILVLNTIVFVIAFHSAFNSRAN